MDDTQIPEILRTASRADKDRLFTEIVNTYRERLYGVIFRYVRNHNDTDDLLQESLVKAYRNLHAFKGDSSIYTWLVRIAMNQSISHFRKRKIRRWLSLDEEAVPLPSHQPSPHQEAEYRELQGVIGEAVDRLPEKQRTAFVLRHYDGLSHSEIASITGRSEGSVKANFFHAINKIKEHLATRYSDDTIVKGLEYEA